MSHAMYQTRALVLSVKNMRESNKLLTLFTERFGLVYVTTQSTRKLSSKMRFHLNRYSLVEVDLVEGRNIWRLTGVHELHSSMEFVGSDWYETCHNIARILLRLCSGEESELRIWNDITLLYEHIARSPEPTQEKVIIEMICVARIMFYLGYMKGEDIFFHADNPFEPQVIQAAYTDRKKIIQQINQGLQSSQL